MPLPTHLELRLPLAADLAEAIPRYFPTSGPGRPSTGLWHDLTDLLGTLAAFADGDTIGVLDATTLRLWEGVAGGPPSHTLPLWDGALGVTMTDLQHRFLAPIAGLRGGRWLLLLKGYERTGTYVSVPVLCDPRADPPFRVFDRVGRDGIGGSEPKFVRLDPDERTGWVIGEVDAGAAAHIDDFIMVATGYRLDLVAGTYGWDTKPNPGAAPPRTIAAGLKECQASGKLWLMPGDLPFAAAAGDELVVTVTRAEGQAEHVERLPLGRRLAEALSLKYLVAAVAAWPDLLVLDVSASELVVHRRRLASDVP